MVRWCPNLGTFNSKNEEILAICCVDNHAILFKHKTLQKDSVKGDL